MIEEFNEMVLSLGNWINTLLSIPSKSLPLLTPNVVLVVVSIFFGYLYGRKAMLGLKTVTSVIFSILFYGCMRWIGVVS